MIDYQVHENADITFVSLLKQLIHIVHSSEARINIVVICNIITLICQRRNINWAQPDNVCTQIFQIIQLADNALQVSDSIIIAVTEAFGIYLISNFFIPPLFYHNVSSPFLFFLIQSVFHGPFPCGTLEGLDKMPNIAETTGVCNIKNGGVSCP